MKYVYFFIFFFAVSCTKDGLISVPIVLNSGLDVNIPSGANTSVSTPFVIDASGNDQVEKYKSLIKSYDVKSVSFQVVDYVGAVDNKVNGTITLGAPSVTITNYVLSSAEIKTLELSAAQLKTLSDDFLNGNIINGTLSGTISSTPATFKIKFVIQASLKVL